MVDNEANKQIREGNMMGDKFTLFIGVLLGIVMGLSIAGIIIIVLK